MTNITHFNRHSFKISYTTKQNQYGYLILAQAQKLSLETWTVAI